VVVQWQCWAAIQANLSVIWLLLFVFLLLFLGVGGEVVIDLCEDKRAHLVVNTYKMFYGHMHSGRET